MQILTGLLTVVLIFAVAALAVWVFVQSLKNSALEGRDGPTGATPPAPHPSQARASPSTTQMPPVPVAAFAWPELGEYDFEVVGESHYQPVLKALMGGPDDHEIDGIGTAILVPEDDNPHDNKAVKVTVQGFTIGYLSRDDARSFRRRLAAKKLGMVPTSCNFMITGGHMLDDGRQAHFGAQLDMKPFDN